MVLAPGKRTVSLALRVMGLGETRDFALYHLCSAGRGGTVAPSPACESATFSLVRLARPPRPRCFEKSVANIIVFLRPDNLWVSISFTSCG
jgi:hypothetical protein